MLKMLRFLSYVAAALLTLGLSSHANAQDRPRGHVLIVNNTDQERKVCLFNERFNMTLLPNRCFTLYAGYSVIWERRGKLREFRVEVFRPQDGIDPLLLSQDNVSENTSQIVINSSNLTFRRFGQADWAPRVRPVYRVKFCNVSYSTKVWLMIGAQAGIYEMTEGFWSIEPDECITINYSERASRTLDLQPADWEIRPFYRAFTTGENPLRWEGQEANGDPLYCVNTQRAFSFAQWRFINADRVSYPCDRDGEEMMRFKPGPDLDSETQLGLVNF